MKNHFLVGDFSAIEARLTFWFSSCSKALQAYRDGKDLYKEFATRDLRLTAAPLSMDPKDARQVGKTSILGLGFGMGPIKFAAQLLKDTGRKDSKLARKCVDTYRGTYPEVPMYWTKLENAFKQGLRRETKAGKITFTADGPWLLMALPSGREICYFKAGKTSESIFYHSPRGGVNHIWGGVLMENAAQGLARDIMAEAMLKCDDAGIECKMTVHDEIVALRSRSRDLETFNGIMNTPPIWAKDAPIAAECGVKERFGK